MPRILVTGMSGTGKSTLLQELVRRGVMTIDTDYDGWICVDGLWDEPRMEVLFLRKRDVVVSGTVENQGKFYRMFDHVVLLSVRVSVLLERLRTRTNSPYGKTPEQEAEVLEYVQTVEPMLRAGADVELDGEQPVEELAATVGALGLRQG